MAVTKQTELAAEFGKATENIINDMSSIFDEIFASKISIDEFAKRASDAIDAKISEAMRDGNKFIDGRYKISLLAEKSFRTSFEIYFKQPTGEFMEMSGESKIFSLSCLDDDGRAELQAKKEISYEVHEPEKTVPKPSADNESVKTS